ncbi:MAG: hypothetical protein ABI868_03125 [Acidobacteriota bacterium]
MAAANRLVCLVLCGVTMQVLARPLAGRALEQAAPTAPQAPPPAGAAAPAPPGIPGSEVAKRLAGVWKAAEDRVPRTTALDIQVFGPDAYEVKNVDLTIQAAGEGVLKVSKAVIGQKGRRYSPSVIEAKLAIGATTTSVTGRLEPAIKVASAEERYLDGSNDRWPRDGSRVTISMASLEDNQMELRYDSPNGSESFGATMTRQRARPAGSAK